MEGITDWDEKLKEYIEEEEKKQTNVEDMISELDISADSEVLESTKNIPMTILSK